MTMAQMQWIEDASGDCKRFRAMVVGWQVSATFLL
jgi:hypothetical protein